MNQLLEEARLLIEKAERQGLILTIHREPTGFAMGSHRPVIRLDTAHIVYRQPGTPFAEGATRYA